MNRTGKGVAAAVVVLLLWSVGFGGSETPKQPCKVRLDNQGPSLNGERTTVEHIVEQCVGREVELTITDNANYSEFEALLAALLAAGIKISKRG